MHQRVTRSAVCVCIFSVHAILTTPDSWAADEDPIHPGNPEQLEEIMVTATHRSENLQDLPLSITALSGGSLEKMNASTFQDYLSSVPGVSFSEVGAKYNRVLIRGISDGLTASGPASGTQSTTGIYIDDSPVTSSTQTFDPTLYDIERVEVLRGPQGTLYGSGSMGGTVRIILNKPELKSLEGAVEGNWGDVAHGGNNYKADAFVNVPIVTDTLGIRAVVDYQDNGGFVNDIGIKGEESNWRERLNARVALLYKPVEAAAILATAMYQDDWFGEQPYHDIGLPDYQQDRIYPEGGYIHNGLYSLTGNYEFGSMNLTSNSSYLDNRSFNGQDGTTTFVPFIEQITGVSVPPDQGIGALNLEQSEVFTQELRLASSGKRLLDWLAGGFYSHTMLYGDQQFDVSRIPAVAANFTNQNIFDSVTRSTRRQLAGFGEATYHATDALSLTAGLRVANYKTQSSDVGQGILNGGNSVSTTEASSTAVTQKYLVDYKVRPENSVYAEAAQGFRDGNGLSPVPYNLCGEDLSRLGYNSSPTEYKPDKLWSYEVGSKNTFLDQRAQVNASVYYVDWKDIQTSLQLPTCKFSIIANAGAAISNGFELETSLTPMQGLRFDGSVSYTNSHITKPPATIPSLEGNQLPLVPTWTWNLTGEYEVPLANGWTAFVRSDVNRVDSRWSGYEGASPLSAVLPSYVLVGARVGVETDKWQVAIFGTNLTDTIPVLSRTGSVLISDTIGEPRVIGIHGRYKF